MGELDWLERGHGSGEGLLPMIKGSAVATSADRVSIRSVLRGPEAGIRPRRRTRRRTKALVGWLLYCCTAVGGTAAAFTVRDTLFPSLGSERSRSLWVGGPPDRTLPSDTTVASAARPVVVEDSAAPDESTATSIEEESSSLPDDSTTVGSADDKGSDTKVPSTGTTVARATPSGTTVTTVDDHGAGDPQTSASTPSSVEASTPSSSVPGSTDDGHQNGKGGGGGSGSGGGSGGGGSNP